MHYIFGVISLSHERGLPLFHIHLTYFSFSGSVLRLHLPTHLLNKIILPSSLGWHLYLPTHHLVLR
ncbi:hypothetical protein LINPERHAP2_LOCUS14941 [Linum perenne]